MKDAELKTKKANKRGTNDNQIGDEDSARKPIIGNEIQGKNRVGNVQAFQDDDFTEDYAGRIQKGKQTEQQRNQDRGMRVNQDDDFNEDEAARRRRKEAEKARKDGKLGINRNDDFEEDDVARRRRKEA